MTGEHGLLDVSLLKHVQAIFALLEALLLWFGFVFPSKERSRGMGQDMLDQCCGEKYVNSCTASSCRQSQLRTFQHFYYVKKIKVITLATYPRKKDFNPYLRPVSLSNSI